MGGRVCELIDRPFLSVAQFCRDGLMAEAIYFPALFPESPAAITIARLSVGVPHRHPYSSSTFHTTRHPSIFLITHITRHPVL